MADSRARPVATWRPWRRRSAWERIVAAAEHARRASLTQPFGSDDLLVGIMGQTCRTTRYLRARGVDQQVLRHLAEQTSRPLDVPTIPPAPSETTGIGEAADVPLTGEAEQSLTVALAATRHHRLDALSVDQIALGLLGLRTSRARALLERAGVEVGQLTAALSGPEPEPARRDATTVDPPA